MGHFNVTRNTPTAHKVPQEWLTVSGQIGRLVNDWARRKDLLAVVHSGAGGRAAACYYPLTASVEIDTVPAFGKHIIPSMIGDFTLRSTHFDYPKATGAILHEAYHAKYSTNKIIMEGPKHLNPNEVHWFILMEEPRIEGLAVYELPQNRQFLRACALGIVLADITDDAENLKKQTRAYQAAHTAILALGRVDAGVLDPYDVRAIKKHIMTVIGKDLLKSLRELWREFLDLDSETGFERMLEIAREFNALIEEKSKEEKPEDGEKGEGQPGEGAGEPEDGQGFDPGDFFDKMKEAIEADQKAAGFDVDDMINKLKGKEAADEAAGKKAEQQQQTEENKRQAKTTFDFSAGTTGNSYSSKISSRPPSLPEQITANRIADALKKARYRDRLVTVRKSELPPGKLRTGTAMQAHAVRMRGGTARVDPWKFKVRKHVEDPNLTLGIMCDISGSMAYAMEPISVASWVMAEAVRRIHGTAATVYFGRDVFPTLKPREHQKTVDMYDAADSVEAFNKGFKALDGALTLLNGTGARLLVVCSDGQYGGHGELEACIKWLSACRENGVAVVWLDNKDSHVVAGICEKTGAHQVVVGKDVTAAATAIGDACIKALNAASR